MWPYHPHHHHLLPPLTPEDRSQREPQTSGNWEGGRESSHTAMAAGYVPGLLQQSLLWKHCDHQLQCCREDPQPASELHH